MEIRVAVATDDEINVAEHFAKAVYFNIYSFEDNNFKLIERKENFASYKCSDDMLSEIINKISDCKMVVSGKVGPHAINMLLDNSTRAFLFKGKIEESLKEILSKKKLNYLLGAGGKKNGW
jgi:nitrogen fixation protein NifX